MGILKIGYYIFSETEFIMKRYRCWFFNKERVEQFSDGIFAIIITLLVLDLKVPEITIATSSTELFLALMNILPNFLSWLLSFFTIITIWINHHKIFEFLRSLNYYIFLINAFLLIFICFIPFPTALIGRYFNNKLAVFIYGITFGFMELSFYIMKEYIIRASFLLKDDINKEKLKKESSYSFIVGPLLYFIAAAMSMFHPAISLSIYLVVPIYFAI